MRRCGKRTTMVKETVPPANAKIAKKFRLCGLRALCVPLAAFAISASTAAAQPTAIATIKDIRRTVLPDAVRVTIELDREVRFHDERIPDPMRVFVDLPGTRAAASLMDQTIRYDLDGDIVHQVRLGRHPNHTTRVVLDAVDVSSYSVYPLYQPFRIVLSCVRPAPIHTAAGAPAWPAGPPPLHARSLAPTSTRRRLPVSSPRGTSLLASVYAAMPRDPEDATTSTTTTAE